MPVVQAARRLVKSPPELWAEVSDAASLAKHLGAMGEITITRLEPETTVAWEGERASGTVELAPAGWGTSVTLTAEPVDAVEPTPAEPVPVPEPEPVATSEPEPVSTVTETPAEPRRPWWARLFKRAPVATAEAEPVEAEAEAIVPEPAAVAEPEPEPVAEPEPRQPEPDPLEAVLTGALDSLGQAHHRPFSRG